MKKSILISGLLIASIVFVAYNSSRDQQGYAYEVIRSSSLYSLEQQVQVKLKGGWTFAGGIFFAENNYMQAMSK